MVFETVCMYSSQKDGWYWLVANNLRISLASLLILADMKNHHDLSTDQSFGRQLDSRKGTTNELKCSILCLSKPFLFSLNKKSIILGYENELNAWHVLATENVVH